MIHPNTEIKYINHEVGYGVVATHFIPAGTITWVLDQLDREFTPEQVKALPHNYQDLIDTYCFRNNKGNFVLCWDHGRFVNHSFQSNCLTTAYDFEIAIRDIHPGEQLTDDYGYLNISQPFRGIDEGTRRKTVYPDDLKRYSSHWDKKLLKVFPLIPKVNQPLADFVPKDIWNHLTDIWNGKTPMASIYTNFYDEKCSEHSSVNHNKIPM